MPTDIVHKLPSLSFAEVVVRVTGGPDAGRELRLEPGRTRIGTTPSCELQLADPAVSRLHCELHVEPDGLRVIDSGSTNGTWVNGVRVTDARVADRARLELGKTTIAVDSVAAKIEVALAPRDHFGPLLGASPAMRRVFHVMATVAPTNATVLIHGETGTGKELAALAIHEASQRAAGPFVALDCGSIAEHLIESELFGHVRGAFTGATSHRIGIFEEAARGTLFLDEIGELPMSLQPKLLRALEEREVRPVGSNTPRPVDVRVIAATNRSLALAVNQGNFREDLYYRLAVFEIALPALRDRASDIAALANHFYAHVTGKDVVLPDPILASIEGRGWPGNVRELRNFIERSAILGWGFAEPVADATLAAGSPSLESFVTPELSLKQARDRCMMQFEALYITQLLRRTAGNVTRAAEIAGVSRRYLHRLLTERGIRNPGKPDL